MFRILYFVVGRVRLHPTCTLTYTLLPNATPFLSCSHRPPRSPMAAEFPQPVLEVHVQMQIEHEHHQHGGGGDRHDEREAADGQRSGTRDKQARKSTRLNSSH